MLFITFSLTSVVLINYGDLIKIAMKHNFWKNKSLGLAFVEKFGLKGRSENEFI